MHIRRQNREGTLVYWKETNDRQVMRDWTYSHMRGKSPQRKSGWHVCTAKQIGGSGVCVDLSPQALVSHHNISQCYDIRWGLRGNTSDTDSDTETLSYLEGKFSCLRSVGHRGWIGNSEVQRAGHSDCTWGHRTVSETQEVTAPNTSTCNCYDVDGHHRAAKTLKIYKMARI